MISSERQVIIASTPTAIVRADGSLPETFAVECKGHGMPCRYDPWQSVDEHPDIRVNLYHVSRGV